ncbi:hypothetical protein LUZ60_004173 [Juncus effusus]|nr:hypothetical protein LUZ60_004173 [Juncus effusus]
MSKGSKWDKGRHLGNRLAACIVTLIIIILLIILIVYLALRPTKPKFYLQNLHLIKILNSGGAMSAPATLTTNLQVTISARNPNNHVGVYFDMLDTYVTYRDTPITSPVLLPPTYEGHKDVAVWSPVLNGVNVPLDMYTGNAIMQDQQAGIILLHVKVEGRVKWKVGTWTSGHYHLFVNCPIFVSLNGGTGNSAPGDGLSQFVECHVED